MLTAVVNHLWQSTLLVAAVAALAALLRNNAARTRYWLWWAASVKFLVPFALLTWLGGALAPAARPFEELASLSAALGRLAEPMPASTGWPPLDVALAIAWACGCAAVLSSYAVRALRLRNLLRCTVPWAAGLPPRVRARLPEVRSSTALLEPALVGIVRPVLLLPQGIERHLSQAQLDAVLAHELCHFKRRDNLTAAVHMLVEAVLWFYPLVWWLGARLVEERERACDEAVVGSGHDGRTYAEGILNVCQHYVASSLKCAAGVSGADLKRRVIEISEIGRARIVSALPVQKKLLLGAFALSTLVVPIILGAVSTRAAAQGDDVIPLVRTAPEYPAEALAQRREGWVKIEFTITPEGAVADAVVLDSSSPEFNEPTLAAVQKWRYSPQQFERHRVQTIIRYQLEP